MATFFTSDTHFSSDRTLKLSRRPFVNTEEMDNCIISNWNNMLNDNDIIYHLGDFGNYSKIKQLNGNIILILGNYEEKELKEKFNNNFDEYKKYLLSLGFKNIIKKGTFIEIENNKIYLTHQPTDCKKDYFNLFGHIHKLGLVKKFGLNVGIDCFNFKPASIDDILFYKNAIENHYDNDVFCQELE